MGWAGLSRGFPGLAWAGLGRGLPGPGLAGLCSTRAGLVWAGAGPGFDGWGLDWAGLRGPGGLRCAPREYREVRHLRRIG